MPDPSSIAGQVAIVTGGTAGIGRACAERFAREGAKVAIVGRTPEKGAEVIRAIEAEAGEAMFLAGDCTVESDMRQAVEGILSRWKRVDILVNCAGGFYDAPPIEDVDAEMWSKGLALNLTSKFLITREVTPAMKRAGYGRIVNVSSIGGRTAQQIVSIDYAAAKAGVIGLTRRLAIELGPSGITANTIAPGVVRSPRVERVGEELLEHIGKNLPVGRIGTTEELAHAIWYLCTPGAGFTTGAVLDVNGGAWTG